MAVRLANVGVTIKRISVALVVCLAAAIVSAPPAQAQPIFEKTFEGDIWKTNPPFKIGRDGACVDIIQVAWDNPATEENEEWWEWFNDLCAPNLPALDEFLLPADVTVFEPTATTLAQFPNVTEKRVYVTDRYNNRILAFREEKVNGQWTGGWEIVSLPNAEWNGTYVLPPSYGANSPGGGNTTLYWPEHLAIDAKGYLWVTDLENHRIVIFTPDGDFVDVIHLTDPTLPSAFGIAAAAPDELEKRRLYPYGIDVKPGGAYATPGSRIAVIAHDYQDGRLIHLITYEVNASGQIVELGRRKANGDTGGDNFYQATGVAWHTAPGPDSVNRDRLIVSDKDANRILVFELDNAGAPQQTALFSFGDAAINGDPASTLFWPYSVEVDSRNRLLVSDTLNQRLTAFSVDFTTTPPTAEYLFQINSNGGLNGDPRGIAKDSSGRLYVVDTGNNEVEVFEIPSLALVDIVTKVDGTESTTAVQGNTITVEFTLMVPETKSAVGGVVPTCSALTANLSATGAPVAIAGTPALPPGGQNMSPVSSAAAGPVYRYACSFTAGLAGPFDISITAAGDGGNATAPTKVASGEIIGCPPNGCERRPPTITGRVKTPAPINGFLSDPAVLELTARDMRGSNTDSGVWKVLWRFRGAMAAQLPATSCTGYAADVFCQVYPSLPGQQIVEIPAAANGDSRIEFWAIDGSGNESTLGTLSFTIDTVAPSISLSIPTTIPPGNWWNSTQSWPYTTADEFDLTPAHLIQPTTNRFATFSGEGHNQNVTVTVTDLAGNSTTINTRDYLQVNIDRGAPLTTASVGAAPLVNGMTLQGQAAITFAATDRWATVGTAGAPSGLNQIWYAIDGATTQSTFASHPTSASATTPLLSLGARTIEYWATDIAGNVEGRRTASIYVNAPPVAVNDTATVNESGSVTIAILANDSDANAGETLTPTIVGTAVPNIGTFTLNANNTLTYTAPTSLTATTPVVLTYRLADTHSGVSNDATVTVTVVAINDPPIAVDDAVATDEDVTLAGIAVLGNDTDEEGAALNVTSFTQAANGVVTKVGNTFTYDPADNFFGTDSFTYVMSDGTSSATGTVTITVRSVNDLPTAGDDAASTNEDTAVTVAVLSNDSDVESAVLTLSIVTAPAQGSAVINGNGTITYTPAANASGTVTFTYRVTDANGAASNTATVTITINAVNDAPVANADAASTNEDTAVTIGVTGNDTDADGDTLTITGVTQGAHGTVALGAAGQVVYTPAANFSGTDTFTYSVADGNGGTATASVTVTVVEVNDAPVAGDDAASTNEDTAVTISVLANDTDVEGTTLTPSIVSGPAHGTAIVNGNGTITYTPPANLSATTVTFTYRVADAGNLTSNTATVSVTINGVNDAPVAHGDTASTNEDTSVTIGVTGNDTDVDGDTLSVASFSQGAHGSVAHGGAGQVVYTPAAHYFGTDSFTYSVSDGNGGTATATVTVTVTEVNDAPSAGNDGASTDEHTAVTITVLANDSDIDGDNLSVTNVSQPPAGYGTVTVNANGTITYTPPAHQMTTQASVQVPFTYQVSDGRGGVSNEATVTVTIHTINDAPVANDDTATTGPGVSVAVDVRANDTDEETPNGLYIVSVTQPASGQGTVSFTAANVTFAPNASFYGQATFTYTVSDGNSTDTATVRVTVTEPSNLPPNAVDDTTSTQEDHATVVAVLGNDTDPNGHILTVTGFTQAGAAGTVSSLGSNGQLLFTPAPNFHGTATFTYTVSDGRGLSDTATVTITVTPVNDLPDAIDDLAQTDEDTAVTIPVLTNDIDPDTGTTLTVTSVSQPFGGVVTVQGSSVMFAPSPNWFGTTSFSYSVSDGSGGNDTATVYVTVAPVNDNPVCDSPIGGEIWPPNHKYFYAAPITGLTDPDGDYVTYTVTSIHQDEQLDSHGDGKFQPDGRIENGMAYVRAERNGYENPASGNGRVYFLGFTAQDGNGGSCTGTATWTVPRDRGQSATATDSGLRIDSTTVTAASKK